MRRIFFALVAVIFCTRAEAQRKVGIMEMVKLPKKTICYSSNINEFTTIGAPRKANAGARTKTANIEVTYNGFTSQARASFQEAVDIWESILETDVTIHIEATWAPLGPNVLGSAGPGNYYANFDGAPKEFVYYPVALAEKITGKNINGNDPDIVATFNSTNDSWHYGLVGVDPPEGKYDLLTVVLHEIGHGLGITHAYSVESGNGVIPDYFNGTPVVFETNLIDANGNNVVNTYSLPSTALKDVLTGQMFYSSPLVRTVNSGDDAVIYTPKSFDAGSSIAHLDETTYPAGTPNSLMTPALGFAERILDPGPIVRNILKDIGWIGTFIHHEPLKNTENTTDPYHAVVQVTSDNGYNAANLQLNYRTSTSGSFTATAMVSTGNANEYAADIPAGSSIYQYYVSILDNDNRTFTTPGIEIKPGMPTRQGVVTFEAGPDTKAPIINHTPKEFVSTTESLTLQAIVSDNIGINEVVVEYNLNDGNLETQAMTLVANTDSTYEADIHIADLQTDDKIKYRIRAEDSSVAGNTSYKPSQSGFYAVNVVGLGETKTFYENNFDDLSAADFFGEGFTVSTPSGFDNGAIHSDHPYEAGGAEGTHVDLIYTLKTPIHIAEDPADAILKFDEIVLVEPGEDGAAWPSDNFFDYVVVEGSTDGGITWTALADGYDSRYNAAWLSKWNSSSSDNNSTATGAPSLYRTHSFDLQDKFQPGEDVAFRFRLFSDPFSVGWGWSIDNLRIQIDDIPPTILHKHIDFALDTAKQFVLKVKVNDAKGVEKITFQYGINSFDQSSGGNVITAEIPVLPGVDTYTQKIILADLGLTTGDDFYYRFEALDSSGNTGSFPATGAIRTSIVTFDSPLEQLISDVEANVSDTFVGNFFVDTKPASFTNVAMHSNHPYPAGMGIDYTSDFVFMTRKAIKINADNPSIFYQDIALVEYSGSDVKDYVIVEGSKDGSTWEQLTDPYAANSVNLWKSTFDAGKNGTSGLYESHVVDITESGAFVAGDEIFVRFRLHSDSSGTGWGWAVDNISIQGPVTGVEPTWSSSFDAWPNPVTDGSLHLKIELPASSEVSVEILTTQGQLLSSDRFSAPSGDFQRDYEVKEWPNGFYLLRVSSEFGSSVQKLIKAR